MKVVKNFHGLLSLFICHCFTVWFPRNAKSTDSLSVSIYIPVSRNELYPPIGI